MTSGSGSIAMTAKSALCPGTIHVCSRIGAPGAAGSSVATNARRPASIVAAGIVASLARSKE